MNLIKLNELKIDSFYYFIARLFPALASLLAIALFIRLLGKEVYGSYALLQAAILLVGNVSSIWISQAVLRFYSRFNSVYARQIFNTAIFTALIYTLVISISFFGIFIIFFLKVNFINFLIAVLAVAFLSLYGVLNSLQQASLKPRRIVLAEFCRAFVSIILPLTLLYFLEIKSYTLLLIGSMFSYLLACGVILLKLPISFSRQGNTRRFLKKIIMPFGIPIAIWLGLSVLLNTSDRFVIKYFMDAKAVGVYSAVYDVVYNSFGLVLAPILYAAHPRIVFLWNRGEKTASMLLMKKAIILEIFLGGIAVVALQLLAPLLVTGILGQPDPTANQLVAPVAAGAVLWQLAMLVHKRLEMTRKITRMVIYILCAFVVNFVGNVLLIPAYGYVASAYTTAISAFVYMLLVFLDALYNNTFQLRIFPLCRRNSI